MKKFFFYTLLLAIFSPSFAFAGNSISIKVGDSATISWATTNTSCVTGVSPDPGAPVTGQWSGQTFQPNTSGNTGVGGFNNPGTFSFNCTDNTNNIQDFATITVYPIPTASLSVAPTLVSYNASAILTWGSTNATSCTGGGFNTGGATGGSVSTGNLTASQTYTLYCSGPAGGTSQIQSVSVVVCPPGYLASNGMCTNPSPTINISPTGTLYLSLGQSLPFTSLATDASSDITIHNMEWQTPTGVYNWQGPAWGTVSYGGPTTFVSGTGNSNLSASFTPDHLGRYAVRFAAQDNSLSNYNGQGPRWVYSAWTYVYVINGTTATIYPDPTDSSKLKWECFNADLATLVTTGGPTLNDFTNKAVPPSSGSFTPSSGATYTLTCKNNTSGQISTFTYSMPTLTSSNVGATSAGIAWNCNNANAKSVVIERSPGSSSTYNQPVSTRTDTDLSPNTDYTYTLRCFDALNATGNQIGVALLDITTIGSSGQPSFNISAYIRGTSSDPLTYSSTQPMSSATSDGSFYSWSYRITSGTAQSCVMDQRNDGGAWYPSPAYATDPSTYTLNWSNLTSVEKSQFANSFSSQHDWRITCTDSTGKVGTLIWSLVKSNAFPTVIDASLNPACGGGSATISVQCANSDYFDIKDSNGAIVQSGGTSGVVTLPAEGSYSVTCKTGGANGTASRPILRTYSTSMCTASSNSFTASPVAIQSGGLSTLKWIISNPSPTCVMSASPVCAGACTQGRIDEANNITNGIADGSILTDANDVNNIAGVARSVKTAVQTEAYNNNVSGKALGKKTFRLNYTTDFQIQCGASIQKLRVLITNDNEG